MRIAIDARELAGQPTGVGRFLREVVRQWATMLEAAQHEFIFCAPAEILRGQTPDVIGLRFNVEMEPGAGTMWEQRVLPRLAGRARADVLFCPGYSGPMFGATPLVVAIHDVSFAAHPEWFRWREGLRRRFVTRRAAQRAVRVLTISEFSRREIADHLGIAASKIHVAYPGVSSIAALRSDGAPRSDAPELKFRPTYPTVSPNFSSGRSLGPNFSSGMAGAAPEPLILYVGSIFNRRHVPETIRGLARLTRDRPDARLAIVGDNRTFPPIDLAQVISETQQADRVQVLPYVSDDVLSDLYRRARAFVFLSEYEGFGLTPLEALASGTPIVVLDTPVALEVYGDAAIYVAAPDPRLIASALEKALFDEETRQRVLRRAPAILARYSWRECARQVLTVLESAR